MPSLRALEPNTSHPPDNRLVLVVHHQAPRWVLSALAPFLRATEDTDPSGAITRWQFQSRYFSSQIFFTMGRSDGSLHHFVAKFPKVARSRGYAQLPARLPEDLELAAEEYRALRILSDSWPNDRSQFVQPLFYDPVTGLLVFPFIAGDDLYTSSLARQLLVGSVGPGFLADIHKLGGGLGSYHKRVSRPGEFIPDKLIARIETTGHQFDAPVPAWLHKDWKRPVSVVPGIRGFEVRNARRASGHIWLFDPGRLRDEPAEADVARFIVSLKILTWGTIYFVLPSRTSEVEEAFLAGYVEHRNPDAELVRLHALRELSWNWTESVEATRLKRLPAALQHIFTTSYVNPGFQRLWNSIASH